ncbi:MAG: cytochrome ubiquinol oxidase subunit I [Bryobacteraceae bacterium]|nr:cytochrome ubiquinol oxidase subunit I [Bryobacteraceae bacterium]
MDVTVLSRVQFALTIMFHYLFPPLTIGMGVVLVYLEAMYLRTKEPIYETAARFWTGLYAVSFAMGVATGIVMEFQFGTNWANYSRFVGDVFGSALAAEGIFAFFLESGFLAILVFGWDKVTPRFHFLATLLVASGSIFSSVWIVVANSWQHTPAGHAIVERVSRGERFVRAEVVDYWGVVFNPSTVNRLSHTLIGAFVLGAFFIMSISAWYLLRDRHTDFAQRSFKGALIFATLASLMALVSGHKNAEMIAYRQPAKLAAFEGHFKTGPAELSLFGIPDVASGELKLKIAVPGMLSLLVHGDPNASVIGLDRIPRELWPPVAIPFFMYHLMVALGLYFIGITLTCWLLLWRGTLFTYRPFLWLLVISIVGPFLANEAGWVSTEVGRQPWVVHPNVLRDVAGNPQFDAAGMLQYNMAEGLLTRNAISPSVRGPEVLASIIMFSLIYLLLFWVWLYVLNDKIQKGPKPVKLSPHPHNGWLASTAGRTLHEESMSQAKDSVEGGR